MKRWIVLILALALLLTAGCGSQTAPAAQTETETQTETASQTLRYTVKLETFEQTHSVDDTPVAHAKYEYPVLRVVTEDGSEPTAEIPQEMQAVCDVFNARFADDAAGVTAQPLFEIGEETYKARLAGDTVVTLCEEETRVNSLYRTDSFISVDRILSSDWGGAHPNAGEEAVNFDLEKGEFIEWTDMTDDEAGMRAFLGEQVLQVIASADYADGLFEDYEQAARALTDAVVSFDETGMVISFPEYTLGPHAVGLIGVTVLYGDLGSYLNARGQRLLNKA